MATELWWTTCGKCNERLSITLPQGSTKQEVVDGFKEQLGVNVLPCLCKKCQLEKEGKNG